MDNDRGIPKTGIPFAVQMVREKIGALRVMPTREEIQKLLAIRMQTGAGLVEFTHSHNLHKIISTHLLTWLIAGRIQMKCYSFTRTSNSGRKVSIEEPNGKTMID